MSLGEKRRFNDIAMIIDPPPYEPMSVDTPCPAKLRVDGDRIYKCGLVVRAGRTKHRDVHDWVGIWQNPYNQEG